MKIQLPKWSCKWCRAPAVPWRTLGLALLVVAALAWRWTRERRALADALRGREAAELSLRGQIVAEQESSSELRGSVAKLLAENDLIKQAYEEALRQAPGAQPESAARLETGPVRVAQAPPAALVPRATDQDDGISHPPPPPPCSVPLKPDGVGGFYCPEVQPTDQSRCVLSSGNLVSLRVDELVLRTERGNRLVAGTAEVWRETPPRSKLAAGKFSSALSGVDSLAPPPEPGWGAEVAALCTRDGCGPGLGALLPPFRVPLLGWRGEARAGALAGPVLGAYGALGVRF